MKKTFFILLCLLLGLNGHTQESDKEDLTSIYKVYETFNQLVPYYDEAQNLSIYSVSLNKDLRYLQLNMQMENDRPLETDADVYLRYLVSDTHWSLAPFVEHSFELRLSVRSSRKQDESIGKVYVTYTYKPVEIRNMMSHPMVFDARKYLNEYAEKIRRSLPIKTNSQVWLVECHFDDDNSYFYMTDEYGDTQWSEIRRSLSDDYDNIQRNLAIWMATDTTNALGAAFLVGDVALKYCYRNQSKTDSVEFIIAPWMFEQVFKILEEQKKHQTVTNMERLQNFVDLCNRQLISERDTLIVSNGIGIKGFELDTAARRLSVVTETNETEMLKLQSVSIQTIRKSLAKGTLNTQVGRELVRLLVAADVEMRCVYVSPYSNSPIIVIFDVESLGQMLH